MEQYNNAERNNLTNKSADYIKHCNMDKFFYVTDGLNKIGPYSRDEVLQMLFSAHISLTDSILDTRDNMLCPLLQHEDFGGAGNVNATMNRQPISTNAVANKIDFSSLRNEMPKTATDLRRERKERQMQGSAMNPAVAKAQPEEKTQLMRPTPANDATSITQITTTTRVINSNNNLNFYLKLKDQEYGPFKFLVLLSLYKGNKIGLDTGAVL